MDVFFVIEKYYYNKSIYTSYVIVKYLHELNFGLKLVLYLLCK